MILQSELASDEDKKTLAAALFYLRQPSTGSVEGDVLHLAELINGYVSSTDCSTPSNFYVRRLVIDLGLQSTLAEYKVPTDDLASIAGQALGNNSHPHIPRVVKLLESLYSSSR